MSTQRQGDTDTRLKRLWICRNSSTFKDEYAQTLKHSDEGHTETRTQKPQNTGRDSGTLRDGDIQTLMQRLIGCTTQGCIKNGTQKFTDLQGVKDMQILDHNIQWKSQTPDHRDPGMQKPWETEICRHGNTAGHLLI